MELLPDGQKNTASEVSWSDQQKINKFSSLINIKDEKSEQLKKFQTEKDYVDDLALEIELLDEGEKIQYKIGEVLVFLTIEQTVQKIEKENEDLSLKIESVEEEIEALDEQLGELKKQLYAKFGSNINLER